jgi:hypothetical protein
MASDRASGGVWRRLALALGDGSSPTEERAAELVRRRAFVLASVAGRVFRLRDPDAPDLIADEAAMRLAAIELAGGIDAARGNAGKLLWGITLNVGREHARGQRRDARHAAMLRDKPPEQRSSESPDVGLLREEAGEILVSLKDHSVELLARRFRMPRGRGARRQPGTWEAVDSVRLHRLLNALRRERDSDAD